MLATSPSPSPAPSSTPSPSFSPSASPSVTTRLTTPDLILQAPAGATSELLVELSYQKIAAVAKRDMTKTADEVMLSNTPTKSTEGLSKVRGKGGCC